MTLEEAEKVGDIVKEADGGCSTCVAGLINLLNSTFTEFTWTMKYDYKNDILIYVTKT